MSRASRAESIVAKDEKTTGLDIKKMMQNMWHPGTSIELSGKVTQKKLGSRGKDKNRKKCMDGCADFFLDKSNKFEKLIDTIKYLIQNSSQATQTK